MKIVIAFALLAGAAYVIWWGYKNLLRRESQKGIDGVEAQLCHICRRPFPLSELVIREKMAGFENYFCGECIKSLYQDYELLGIEELRNQRN